MPNVKIRRIRTNFQVRFGYDEDMIKFVKSLPNDQIKTSFETVISDTGQVKKDWFHICNIHGLIKVIWYCHDKNIIYHYDNLNEKDIYKIEDYSKKRILKLEEVKKFKSENFDISKDDYSFMKLEPYPYQKRAISFFEICNGVALLGDEPGVGKTLPAFAYAVKHKFKTIIICPASMTIPWAKEIMLFTHEIPYLFKYKAKKKNKNNLILGDPETSNIHIISYNGLETYLKFDVHHKCENTHCDFEETSKIKKYKTCPKCFKEKSVKSRNTDLCSFADKKGVELKTSLYDLVILDEAHYCKNPKTARTKVVNAGFKKTPKKIMLSGTAVKNKPYEFFPILNFLDPFEWVNSHTFGVKYCNGHEDEFGHWNYDGASNLEQLYDRISYIYLRRRKSDPGVLEHLPPKTYTIIPIYLSAEELRDYKKLEGKIIDETSPADDKMTHLARVQKLKFFTSKICANRALEFIKNIIDGDEKIVVFSQYVETTRFIYESFKENAVWYTGKNSAEEKEEAREKFMTDDNIKVFSGTLGAAGVGLTLTSSSTVLFIDQPWTPSDRIQAEDRIHRASQKSEKAQIIRLITQETIDEKIEELLNSKEKITSQVLDGEYIAKSVSLSIFSDLVNMIIKKKKESV